MGLKNRTESNVKYVKLKDGRFYLSKDETNTPFDELEGTLADIQLRDEEYEGTPIRKLYLTMLDGDDKYIVGFSFDSSYTSSFIGFLKNADLSENISLHPMLREENVNGKDISKRSLLVSQNGKFLKSFFTKDNPNGLPKMKKIKVSGKEVWDKTDMLEFYENLLVNEFRPKIANRDIVTSKVTASPVATPDTSNGETEDALDELPF